MKLLKIIKSDFKVNKSAGLFSKLVLLTYRLGATLKNRYVRLFISLFHKPLCLILGCSLPYECKLGEFVRFPHGLYGVFISRGATIGNCCTILHHVTIGSKYLDGVSAPVIGNNVQIGVGAVIVGVITIGDFAKVAPNTFVCFDVPEFMVVTQSNNVSIRAKKNVQ